MFKRKEVELKIPKWQLGILLVSSAVLLLLGTVFESFTGDLALWLLISGFVLFLPAYAIVGIDIASRRITHRWFVFMLTIPILAPFVYVLVRDRLKPELPELV